MRVVRHQQFPSAILSAVNILAQHFAHGGIKRLQHVLRVGFAAAFCIQIEFDFGLGARWTHNQAAAVGKVLYQNIVLAFGLQVINALRYGLPADLAGGILPQGSHQFADVGKVADADGDLSAGVCAKGLGEIAGVVKQGFALRFQAAY